MSSKNPETTPNRPQEHQDPSLPEEVNPERLAVLMRVEELKQVLGKVKYFLQLISRILLKLRQLYSRRGLHYES